MLDHLTVVTHPLVQHKLTIMRNKETSTAGFRRLLREISLLLAYEVTRELDMTTATIQTPLREMQAPILDGKKLALISILRAGNGLLDGILELVPAARVGFIGLYRDPETLKPVQYYAKVPDALEDRLVIAVDPMLATGNSSAAAIDLPEGEGGEEHPLPLPSRRPRGRCAHEGGPSRRADRDSGCGRMPGSPRIYCPRARRCGRPHVRHQIRETPLYRGGGGRARSPGLPRERPC